ncbi:MAG: hypothetical protein AAGD47_03425 [Pseudomonadota bacterium]
MTQKPVLGIVCGMQSEFATLGRLAIDPRLRVTVSGARPDLAEDGAEWLIEEGCRYLLSWGVAGGLDPASSPGALIAATHVTTEAGATQALTPAPYDATDTGAAATGPLLGLDRVALTAPEKQALHAATGALAVDMETHRVAKVAQAHGLPVSAVRVISDAAARSLPPFVADALSITGHPRIGPVLMGLLKSPGALPDLLRLKRDTSRALGRLAGLVEAGLLERFIEAADRDGSD